jgi:hypothetical protein
MAAVAIGFELEKIGSSRRDDCRAGMESKAVLCEEGLTIGDSTSTR